MNLPRVFVFAGSHPIYESLVQNPPAGFEVFSNISKDEFDRLTIYSAKGYRFVKRIYIATSHLLGLPRIYFPPPGYDLIHACRGFIPLSRTPSVVDVEHVSSFTNMDPHALYRSKWLLTRLLSRGNIRYILPHSNAALKSFRAVFGDNRSIVNKLYTIYPAAPQAPCSSIPGSGDEFTILFIGKNFRIKGGFELYKAFSRLSSEYPHLRLVLKTNVSELPSKILSDRSVTVVSEILPRAELWHRLYCAADVFAMPTYMDTFGYVFLEAMAAGLPVIGTDVFAGPEIIQDGYNGFVVHSDIRWHDDRYLHRGYFGFTSSAEQQVVDQLVEKLRILIEDPDLLRKMSKNALYLTTEGKFSIKHRNEQLQEIYESAISG